MYLLDFLRIAAGSCKKLSDEVANFYQAETLVKVDGKEGLYSHKQSMIDKYVRRPSKLENMCLMQFVKLYQSAKEVPKKTKWSNSVSVGKGYVAKETDVEKLSKRQYCNLKKFLITDYMNPDMTEEEIYELVLPKYIMITDPVPGEPEYMSLRSYPLAARLHKFQKNNDHLEYIYILNYFCTKHFVQKVSFVEITKKDARKYIWKAMKVQSLQKCN